MASSFATGSVPGCPMHVGQIFWFGLFSFGSLGQLQNILLLVLNSTWTSSKMFCSCPNDPNEKRPNQNICPTCMGHPGTLPVANEEAIKKVIKTGFALNCEIATESKFDRKNYFYPDI